MAKSSVILFQLILLLSWVNYVPYKVDDYEYPAWANGIGWAIAMLIIAVVPVGFIYDIVWEEKGGIKEVRKFTRILRLARYLSYVLLGTKPIQVSYQAVRYNVSLSTQLCSYLT